MKVIFTKLRKMNSPSGKHVATKRVKDSNGKLTTVNIIDLGSKTLESDLAYVFRKNVVRARRLNKTLQSVNGVERRA